MFRETRRKLWLALASAFLLSSYLVAQDQGREFHWSGKLAAEQVVEIKNINGTIAASPASGDQVEVTAEKSGPDADRVKIEVVPSADGVTICAIYPGGLFGSSSGSCEPGEHWHGNNVHSNKTKVDFTVRLPENLRFSAQNVNGSVKAEGLGRFVRASSVNGSVRVSTKSWAQLSSVNGSIEGRMGRADWSGTLKISTVNGSVDLELPSSLSADVKFRSVNGRLNSDFPLTVSGTFGGRKMDGRVGNGGRELVVETVNGSVSMHHEPI
jgi:putative adhesin